MPTYRQCIAMRCDRVMSSGWQLVVTGSRAAVDVSSPWVFGLQGGYMLAAHVSLSCNDHD
jgi:hypothetical protein